MKQATTIYCQAIKDCDGKQCTRKATVTVNATIHYCKQHYNQAVREKTVATTAVMPEPWAMIGLPEPLKSNSSRFIHKLRRKLFHGPLQGDPGGHIYIYYFEHERILNYWKIGQTEGSVRDRMKKWSAEHGKKVTLYGSFQVERNVRYIEKVIQLYLAYCNMHRYPYLAEGGQRFHSIWMLDPDEVIVDGQQNEEHRKIALNKYVEWYCESIEHILEIVHPVVDTLVWQKQRERKKHVMTNGNNNNNE